MPTPTVGRIVHFFPISQSDRHLANNGADRVPAMIIQAFTPDHLNLVIFPMNVDCPVVLRYSVFHKSQIPNPGESYNQKMSYWDWPEIVSTPAIPGLTSGQSNYTPPNLDEAAVRMTTTDGISGDLTFKKFSEDQRA